MLRERPDITDIIQGDWDYTNDDKRTLKVSNVEEVIQCFNDFV